MSYCSPLPCFSKVGFTTTVNSAQVSMNRVQKPSFFQADSSTLPEVSKTVFTVIK